MRVANTRLPQLVERLGSLFAASLRRAATKHGLKLVQLEALVYLAEANRYSDTPAALADYLEVTKGTVSQTLKALERHGLIVKASDEEDGRVVHCALTEEGRTVVAATYPTAILRALPSDVSDDATTALTQLLTTLQRANDSRTFGICHTCRFFEPRSRGGRCGLTGEPLSRADTTKLCREHADV